MDLSTHHIYKIEKNTLILFCKNRVILLVLFIMIFTTSVFASTASEETKSIFKASIDALDAIEYPVSGRGTAKSEIYSIDPRFNVGGKIFDFAFKNDLTRSEAFSVKEGKRTQSESVWAKGKNSYVSFTNKYNTATIQGDPAQATYRKLGYDFNPETFKLWHNYPISEAIQRILDGPATLSTKLDNDGILQLIADYNDLNKRQKNIIYLDTTNGYRYIRGLRIWEYHEDPNRSYTEFIDNHWNKYKTIWYIQNAEYASYRGIHSLEDMHSIETDKLTKKISIMISDFQPNVNIDDSEFTLESLNIPNGTTVVDRILGTNYIYGVSKISLDDLETSLNEANFVQKIQEEQQEAQLEQKTNIFDSNNQDILNNTNQINNMSTDSEIIQPLSSIDNSTGSKLVTKIIGSLILVALSIFLGFRYKARTIK